MQLIRKILVCGRPAKSEAAPADSPIAVVPPARFSRAPSLPVSPAHRRYLQQRHVQADKSAGLCARLLGWLHVSRLPESVTVQRQRKCLSVVTKAADHFRTKHARASRSDVRADLGTVLESWKRAYAAGCSTEQIVGKIGVPDLFLRADMQTCMLEHPSYDPAIALTVNTLQAVRVAHCDHISEHGLNALGHAAPRFVALASLVALSGSVEVAMGFLPEPALIALRACYAKAQAQAQAQASDMLPLSQFLSILNHSLEGTMRFKVLEAEMKQAWLALRPENTVEPSSAQQTIEQQRAKAGLRNGFEQLIAAHHQPSLLLPWSRLNGLADAIVAARKAGMTDDMIAAEFCQRPLTVHESLTLQRQLSHKCLLGWERDVVKLAQVLLLRSHQVRHHAMKAVSVAAGWAKGAE